MEYIFCTRQDVKAFANMGANSDSFDDLIDSLIRVWTGNAKVFCRREFVFDNYTETYSVMSVGKTMMVHLAEAPLTIDDEHPLTIKCNGETVDPAGYLVNKEKGLIRLDLAYLHEGFDNLVIDYWGGLCTEKADDNDDVSVLVKCPVRSAIANQCAYTLIRTVQANQGQTASNTGRSVSNTTPASMGFLPEVSMVLANYRLNLTGR
ncbi:MAG: hypothetical protein J6Z11_04220 [Candidatus Riflebacteria bacterium]|nr:hypothetical protein [Candidatus Riflebacteria bacterium]